MVVKFSHIADCHIGGWRDPRMKELSIEAFHLAIQKSIESGVDFVLIAGDLFNTAIPDINSIKEVISSLNLLKKKNISCYFIAGSHDFSPSGKTFLDVIEEAELGHNVYLPSIKNEQLSLKFVKDKSGVNIAGMIGKRGQLDLKEYAALDYRSLEKVEGKKIFLFHTTLTELKTKDYEMVSSEPVSILPVGFDYYAGGHVHIVNKYDSDKYHNVVYPGPLFPNSFSEFQKLKKGGFYIVELSDNVKLNRVYLELKQVEIIEINALNSSSFELEKKILDKLKNFDFEDKIVLLRVYGSLDSGKVSDINFNSVLNQIYSAGAYFVMRNTSGLFSEENSLDDVEIESSDNVEHKLIEENLNKVDNNFKDESEIIYKLMQLASSNKLDGERIYDYESRIFSQIDALINKGLCDKNE
jgi:hypothetical protein